MTAKVSLAIACFALLIAAWLFRYSIEQNGQGGIFALDRWTGAIYRCQGSAQMHCEP